MKIIKILKQYSFYIFIILLPLIIFYKMILNGLFPYPGDLLVSFNFPWYSGGWEGYDPWATHKEFIAADAIRQHLPWMKFSIDEIKNNLSIPLWNPYGFSGQPQLANIQTLSLNPLIFIFVLLPLFEAWIIFILLQIPLALFFTYLFMRSLKVAKIPSILSGLAFVFSSYFIYWFEIGIVNHTILWMPLILFSIQKLFENQKNLNLILLIISSSVLLLAGHIQTAVFILMIAFLFYFTKLMLLKKQFRGEYIIFFIIWLFSTFLISGIQIIPMIELYINSPLALPLSRDAFNTNVVPFKNFIALFAPDFFGNPVTKNYWSTIYGDGTPHIGVIPFMFAIYSLFIKRWEVKFFSFLCILILIYVTNNPIHTLIKNLEIPILTGTVAARSMFIFCFSLSVLTGLGLNFFLESKNYKRIYILNIIFVIIYFLLFVSTFIFSKNSSIELSQNLLVSRRNLILPSAILLTFSTLLLIIKYLSVNNYLKKIMIIFTLFFVTVTGGIYQYNKISPLAPKKYFFPDHILLDYLKNNVEINRYHAADTARMWDNLPIFYNINTAEGYGVFRIRRYAELFAAQENKKIPETYERSVASFSDTNKNARNRLYNLTGVKYYVTKDDFSRDAWKQDNDKPNDDVKLVWQQGKFKVYERTKALPRYWLTTNYLIANDDQEILDKIYDDNFDLKTIILEETPNINLIESDPGWVDLETYKPNKINFNLKSNNNSLFFISDTYFNGWNAYIDNNKTKILRADYTFRAVAIPAGSKKLEFKYEPISFKIGLISTVFGIGILFFLIFKHIKKH